MTIKSHANSNEPQSSSEKLAWTGRQQTSDIARPVILASYDNPLPYYNHFEEKDKRKWDDDQEAASNIAKALHTQAYEDSLSNHSQDEDSLDGEDDYGNGPRKPGRKPMESGSMTLEPDIKQKRKAQNRAAQRAFRERKERYVKELEEKIKSIEHAHLLSTSQLMKENQQLKSIIQRLQCQNINGMSAIGFEFSLPHPMNAPAFQAPNQSADQKRLPASKPGQKKNGQRKLVPIAPHPGNRTNSVGRAQPKLMPKPSIIKGIPLQSSSNISMPLQRPTQPTPDGTVSMIIAANSSPEWSASPESSVASPQLVNVNNFPEENPPHSPTVSSSGTENNRSEKGSPAADLDTTFFSADGQVCFRMDDGRSFCELLKDQNSKEAVDRLFAEPIFDLSGALNDASLDHTLPLTTEALTEENLKAQNQDLQKEQLSHFIVDFESEQVGSDHTSSDEDVVNRSSDRKNSSSVEIWQRRI
ncbi:hypothetical protein INT44_008881 [Umbelopsis vinacea]|uniref:BZIP domain-containing protein n=1 Tax=Umbelopsis vinacea TaxID=44442 RepID=A0A8H7Q226_9FUNG|nr:hypothetical protein INT44_008881 [Umbelopsis vinacea]